ncbi:unnamed protein product [Periconia digitata]|uniref:NAD(P)-binding protein n=1 Tax=Periconia digitata TaxID=1303443 RepID=A0A9W4XIY5_9PLEO|nr:unnamed protein product [Periconia digitata]
MPPSKTVFLLGPGYVGLNIIDNLLATDYTVTTLVRKPELGAKLTSLGVHTIGGTLADSDVITAQVAKHDLTINTASSDDLPSVEAVLSGLRQRVKEGLPTKLIHTSGTGTFLDDAKGAYKSDVVYRDDDPSTINTIPDTALHRNVDLAIIKAAQEFGDKAKLVLMVPPVVYGFNPKHERLSLAFPRLINYALKQGYSGQVGKGANVWHKVHVCDLARAYMTLIEYLDSPASTEAVLSNPYFFTEDQWGEFTWNEAAEHVARILHKMGKIRDTEIKPFEKEHYADAFGEFTEFAAGGNSRARGVRLRELGWTPVEKDAWACLEEDEIPFIIASQK